jgi:hypothetical protein
MYSIIALEDTMHPHFMAIVTPCICKFSSGSLAGVTKYDAATPTEAQVPIYLVIASKQLLSGVTITNYEVKTTIHHSPSNLPHYTESNRSENNNSLPM